MSRESMSVEAGDRRGSRADGGAGPGGTEPLEGLTTEAATAGILRVLGELYLEPPTGDRLERVAAWADDWLAAGEQPEDVAGPLRTIRAARDADPEYLRKEFTRLFRGVSRSASPDPPYESLYRDGQLYSSTATEVQHGYRSAGLEVVDAESNEPPDHLGIELQFLAALCENAVDPDAGALAPSRARDAQEWFLDEHLLTWIEGLRGRVVSADPPEFYRAVLDLTVETLHAHRVALHRRPDDGEEEP